MSLKLKKKHQIALGSGVLAVAIGYLLISSLFGTTVYYYTLDELQGKKQVIEAQKKIRVGGQLDKESVDYDPTGPVLRFRLQNEDGSIKLPVVFKDIMPDNLMKSTEIVVTGVLKDGTFYAESMLVKCPSRYESEEEELKTQK